MVKVRTDMTGWIMSEHGVEGSRLTVIKQVEDYVDPQGHHAAQWLCKCSCSSDKYITVTGRNIKSGNTLSCGCLVKETTAKVWRDNIDIIIQASKKQNKIDLSGEFGVGWTTNTNKEFYFDLEDYDKIKGYTWVEHKKPNGYSRLIAHTPGTYSNVISFLSVLGLDGYDHHSRNTLDNRKSNLWKATVQENARNSSKGTNNTSGFIGVSWNKKANKWRAYIMVDYKQISLGYFDDKNNAIKARLKAEKQYFGEFAPQRHLFKEYGIEDGDENCNTN